MLKNETCCDEHSILKISNNIVNQLQHKHIIIECVQKGIWEKFVFLSSIVALNRTPQENLGSFASMFGFASDQKVRQREAKESDVSLLSIIFSS